MTQISITIPETAHWHALIGKAEYHVRHLLPQSIEDYLIRLFIRFEQEEGSVLQVKKPESEIVSMEQKLQRLGDQCLLLCGFYPEASEEYGVPLEEFISMGSEAYEKLATLDEIENSIIFEYLAGNFEQVSDMLFFINSVSNLPVSKQKQTEVKNNENLSVSFNHIEQYSFSNPISHRVLN